jgi:gamma-glutamylcyclotransferase (GGCT)/AIG2-like uncharacterized protein YtfP
MSGPTHNVLFPYAVYGTLRVGQPNSDLWDGAARYGGTGYVRRYRLLSNGWFPYAVPADLSRRIVVDVLWPVASEADSLRERLDRLEGYPHLYDRLLVDVELETGKLLCVMYRPVDVVDVIARTPALPTGDWNEFAPPGESASVWGR